MLPILSGLFVTTLIIANITSVKLIDIGPFTFDGGTIIFPLAYILGDILTEIYGRRAARQVILILLNNSEIKRKKGLKFSVVFLKRS